MQSRQQIELNKYLYPSKLQLLETLFTLLQPNHYGPEKLVCSVHETPVGEKSFFVTFRKRIYNLLPAS